MTTEVAVADVLAELHATPRGPRMHEVLVLGGRARLRMTVAPHGRRIAVDVDTWTRHGGGWLLRWSRSTHVADEAEAATVLRRLVSEEVEYLWKLARSWKV